MAIKDLHSLLILISLSVIIIAFNSSFQDLQYDTKRSDQTSSAISNPVSEKNQISSYFQKVYTGNGIDHMNINLVNLSVTGLKVGDEIGVFDGIYCVGDAIIQEKDMLENSISIVASANDTDINQPNGYTEGHKITLFLYRTGIVYSLTFKTVNNSSDLFKIETSMFASVYFSSSTNKNDLAANSAIKVYPNPFSDQLWIEYNSDHTRNVNCEICDINGKLIRTLSNSEPNELLKISWDGRDNRQQKVAKGIYFLRINHLANKIMYNGSK